MEKPNSYIQTTTQTWVSQTLYRYQGRDNTSRLALNGVIALTKLWWESSWTFQVQTDWLPLIPLTYQQSCPPPSPSPLPTPDHVPSYICYFPAHLIMFHTLKQNYYIFNLPSSRPDLTGKWCLKNRFVDCWLLNVPATCKCISGTDLRRQFYMLPHWDRCCRPNSPYRPVTVYWHRANQSRHWPYNTRCPAG